jgi:hypothetical protein
MCIERIEFSTAEKLSLYYAAPVKSYVMDLLELNLDYT